MECQTEQFNSLVLPVQNKRLCPWVGQLGIAVLWEVDFSKAKYWWETDSEQELWRNEERTLKKGKNTWNRCGGSYEVRFAAIVTVSFFISTPILDFIILELHSKILLVSLILNPKPSQPNKNSFYQIPPT